MMTLRFFFMIALVLVVGTVGTTLLYAEALNGIRYASLQETTMPMDSSFWFTLFELPFLVFCIAFAFMTAGALTGGVFGKGMNLLAWGFLVMAVGHLHMQIDHLWDFNLFNTIFGQWAGTIAWILALVGTWTLSGLGFYKIYRASKG